MSFRQGGTDDWYDFYISRLTRLVEQVHSYRAQENAYRVSLWSDHRTYDGLRVASRREVHASDENGAIGRLEAVAEYSEVRFDGCWPSHPSNAIHHGLKLRKPSRTLTSS